MYSTYTTGRYSPESLILDGSGSVVFSDYSSVYSAGALNWRTAIPNPNYCYTSWAPAIGPISDAIYVSCYEGVSLYGASFGVLLELDNQTGTLKNQLVESSLTEPVISPQGSIITGAYAPAALQGELLTVDSNLNILTQEIGFQPASRAVIMPDGLSVVVATGGALMSWNSQSPCTPNNFSFNFLSYRGSGTWDIPGGSGYTQPLFTTVSAIDNSGTIYTGTCVGLDSRSAADGSLNWTYSVNDLMTTEPTIGGPGVIYIGAQSGVVYAFIDPNKQTPLQVLPSSLSFTYAQSNIGPIQPQQLTVAGGSTPQSFSAAVTMGSSFLSLSPSSGQTPGTVSVSVQDGLSPGQYTGSIAFSTPGQSVTTVPVNLTVFQGGTINLTTNLAAATFAVAGPATYSGSGTTFTAQNAPPGLYTATYGPVSGYATPNSQTLTLSAGGSIGFNGVYSPSRQIILSGITGWSASTYVKNAQWQGQPAGVPPSENIYDLYYAIDGCQQATPCAAFGATGSQSVAEKSYWTVSGSGFCPSSGCNGKKGSVVFNVPGQSGAIVVPQAQISAWSATQITLTPAFASTVGDNFKQAIGVTLTVTAPDGIVSAPLTLPSPNGGAVATIATRGYGQCTWYVANTLITKRLRIPTPAYFATGSITATYVPQQWDVVDFTTAHTAVIISPVVPKVVTNPDGSITTTYTFTIGEMNVGVCNAQGACKASPWSEAPSTIQTSFAVNVPASGSPSIKTALLSPFYSKTIGANAYYRPTAAN